MGLKLIIEGQSKILKNGTPHMNILVRLQEVFVRQFLILIQVELQGIWYYVLI